MMSDDGSVVILQNCNQSSDKTSKEDVLVSDAFSAFSE